MKFTKPWAINNSNHQKGFIALLVAVLILVAMVTISVSMANLIIGQHKISANIIKSSQAYFIAEGGVEDALLRLKKNIQWTNPLPLTIADGFASTTISDIIGGARVIMAEGNVMERIRKVSVVYQISTQGVSFYYGAQVGDGGVIMDDGSTINGNVFSNGPIVAAPNTEITGTVKVAKTGNYIDGATIGRDAFVDICRNSSTSDTLTCSTSTNCTASVIETLTEEIATSTLAISQTQITQWKDEAISGGTTTDYTLVEGQQDYLGPKKIEGDMTLQDQAQLFMTGTIWVTGKITIQNSAQLKLDEVSYGSLSGVIISDGEVILQDAGKAIGTGQSGSYLLLISTASDDSAIIIQNNFEADILFTQNGWITIQDTVAVRELSGYGIHLKNNAEVIYEIGLEDASFSTGPGGSWEVASWREIE